MKESTRVLVALIAAILLGIIIGALGNVSLINAADALAPLGALWVTAIRMTVIPLAAALFGLLPRIITTPPVLPAGAAEAASQIASGGQSQTVASWLTSLI